MCKQQAAMGKSIGNDKYASILMGLLPVSYAATLSGIAAAAEISTTTPNVATVTKLTINEYDRRTLGNDKSDQAFAADAKKKDKKHDVECFNCGNKGHIKVNCWLKGGKEGHGLRKKCNSLKEGGKKVDTAASAEQAGESGKEKEKEKEKEEEEEIEAWAMVEEEEEEASPQIPVMVADEAGGSEMELFNSGELRHMSPFCEQFVTYRCYALTKHSP